MLGVEESAFVGVFGQGLSNCMAAAAILKLLVDGAAFIVDIRGPNNMIIFQKTNLNSL